MGLPVTRITVGLLVLGVLSWAVFLAGTASLHKLFADVRTAAYQLFCLFSVFSSEQRTFSCWSSMCHVAHVYYHCPGVCRALERFQLHP